MSSICGVVGKDASVKVYDMLNIMKHRGEDSFYLFQSEKISYSSKIDDLEIDKRSNFSLGHSRLLISEKEDIIPLEEKYHLFLDGQVYNSIEIKNNLVDTIRTLDGDFAFALFNEEEIFLSRDYIGIKPLYYVYKRNNQNGKKEFAFASEKKALIKVGFSDGEIKTLEPYSLLTFDGDTGIISLDRERPEEGAFDASILIKKLRYAVEKRIRDLNKLGILFSGGIDSTLLVSLCEKDLTCITVGMAGSHDIKEAKKVASFLDIDLCAREFSIQDVKRCIKEVCYAIEDLSALNLSIGIPMYLATKTAKELGLKVVLAGQGADELFGGYYKYLGYKESLNEILWKEFLNIYRTNLERDDKASMANSILLRLPYLDIDVVKYAFQIPGILKIKDGMRKYPLKKAAKEMKLPNEVIKKEKKAMQYGTGFHKLLKKISREFGLSTNEFVSKLKSEVFL